MRVRLSDLRLQAMVMATAATAVALFFMVAGRANAQSYPAKNIRVVVPTSAGSGMDIVGRIAIEKMAQNMGHALVAENIAGANATIGAAAAARAAPDGYTLLVETEALVLAALTRSNLSFDPMRDLQMFGTIARGVFFLVVNPSVPAQSVEELVQLARAKPGSITYGAGGIGGPHHLVMEMFAQANGLQMLYVPYKDSAGTVTALLGGTIQAAMGLPSSFAPHVRSGKFRALGVSSAKRMSAYPEIPTLMERAVNGVEYESWYGLFAPSGTPGPVLGRLHAELGKVVRDSAYTDSRLSKIGLDPFESPSPAAAAALVRTYYDKLAPVVKKAGIKAE
jgi:tripartite-type tricarboxylate transporter receptor subunit TctC